MLFILSLAPYLCLYTCTYIHIYLPTYLPMYMLFKNPRVFKFKLNTTFPSTLYPRDPNAFVDDKAFSSWLL